MKKKVLMVDDDESVLALLTATLERANYTTRCASNAKEVLKIISEDVYPVVITDIVMPDMDGLSLLTKIKEISPDTQVIMMTAFATIDSAILALKNSATSYLRKPFDLDELVAQTNKSFDKYQKLEDNKKLIEELRYAKEYNEKIIENLIYTLIVIDEQGNIKKINRAMEDLLGYSQKDIVGQPALKIFTEAFKLNKWKELLKEKKIKDFPVEFLAKDGNKISDLFSGTLMRNSDGAVAGLIGTTKSQQKKV